MTSQPQPRNNTAKGNQASPGFEPDSVSDLHSEVSNEASTRRRFLQSTVGATVADLVSATGFDFVTPRRATAQTQIGPDAALQELPWSDRRGFRLRWLARDR
jgi:hypothetical protein